MNSRYFSNTLQYFSCFRL